MMENFQTSSQVDKIDQAMARVQGELDNVVKEALNPHYKSKYAKLPAVVDVIRPIAAKHGITWQQHPVIGEPGKLTLMTRLACEGQWITSVTTLPIAKLDPQGYGSALTYARRYTLNAIFGIGEEDDDGNKASTATKGENLSPDDVAAKLGAVPDDSEAIMTMLMSPAAKKLDASIVAQVGESLEMARGNSKELKRIADKLRSMIETKGDK